MWYSTHNCDVLKDAANRRQFCWVTVCIHSCSNRCLFKLHILRCLPDINTDATLRRACALVQTLCKSSVHFSAFHSLQGMESTIIVLKLKERLEIILLGNTLNKACNKENTFSEAARKRAQTSRTGKRPRPNAAERLPSPAIITVHLSRWMHPNQLLQGGRSTVEAHASVLISFQLFTSAKGQTMLNKYSSMRFSGHLMPLCVIPL